MVDTVVALREVDLFRHLPEAELATLARQVVNRPYARNTLVFSQGDEGDGLYIVASGHVSINRANADGNELILAVYEPGESFGELALFDDEPRSASVVSIDDSSLLFLSRGAFRSFLKAHPDALFVCLQAVVRQVRRLTDLADEIALLDVRGRLARRLLRLAEQGVVSTETSGRRSRTGSFRITQQQLASMTGATRESVNKHLNLFVAEGIIRMDRGHIRILDLEALATVSDV